MNDINITPEEINKLYKFITLTLNFDVTELKQSVELYIYVKKDICISSDNEVRMDDDDIILNDFLSMR